MPKKLWSLIAILVLATAAGGWFWWHADANRRLDASRARLTAAGLPLALADVPAWLDRTCGPIDDAANGALAVMAARRLLDGSYEDLPLWLYEWPEAAHVPLPEPEGADAFLASHAAALTRLDEARHATRFRVPIDWTGSVPPIEQPFLPVSCLDAIRVDAAAAVANQDADRLATAIERTLLVARSLDETPFTIAGLTRRHAIATADDLLRRLLPMVDDPLATHARLRAPAQDSRFGFEIAGEIAALEDGVRALGGSSWVLRPWLRNDLAVALDAYAALLDFDADPSEARLRQLAELQRRLTTEGGSIARAFSPAVHSLAAGVLSARRRLAVTAAGARALAFAREHGRWPTDPAELGDPNVTESMVRDGDDLVIGLGEGAWRLTR